MLKVMKMSWFSKKMLGKVSSTAKYGKTRRMRKKNRIKRRKTKDINIFCSFL